MTESGARPRLLLAPGWPKALALFAATIVFSGVVTPTVLVAIPLLVMVGMRGISGVPVFLVATLAMVVAVSGARDGLWFAERAWALLLGGWFVGLTMLVPTWRVSHRSLLAVGGSVAVGTAYLALRAGAWEAFDWTVTDSLMASVTMTLDAITLLREGTPVSPAFVAAMYDMAEAQAMVFPAMIGLASMAALAVAWWVFSGISGARGSAIGPVGAFRFNDHLVWVLIVGLVLLLASWWGEGVTRVGANAVVFMGALYALRGAGVVLFVTGGLSLFGTMLFAFGLLFAAPVVLGAAIMIGIGDTWLDLRARAQDPAT